MLKDDQKNLGIIDTVIVQYGIQAEPSAATKIFLTKNSLRGYSNRWVCAK